MENLAYAMYFNKLMEDNEKCAEFNRTYRFFIDMGLVSRCRPRKLIEFDVYVRLLYKDIERKSNE